MTILLVGCDDKSKPITRYVIISVTKDDTVHIATANFNSDEIATKNYPDGVGIAIGNASGILLDVKAVKKPVADNVIINVELHCTVPITFMIDDFSDTTVWLDGDEKDGSVGIQPGKHILKIEGRPSPCD